MCTDLNNVNIYHGCVRYVTVCACVCFSGFATALISRSCFGIVVVVVTRRTRRCSRLVSLEPPPPPPAAAAAAAARLPRFRQHPRRTWSVRAAAGLAAHQVVGRETARLDV